jgi:uncharacterized membrane protein YGL010W
MKKQQPKAPIGRPIDILFDKYTASHQQPVNKAISYICGPIIVFALLGLSWAIPFPHLNFLGTYASYINWLSFVVAFSIYFYYKMSPILSYIMLLVEFGFYYGILQLEEWRKAGGPGVGELCLGVLIVALLVQFIGQKMEGKRYSFTNSLKFQFYAPIWLLSLVLKRFNVKY